MSKEYDNCPECGSPLLTFHNDSDTEYWIECEDCDYCEYIEKQDYYGGSL